MGKQDPLKVEDITALHYIVGEDTLVALIQHSKGNYQLDASTLIKLKEKGLSNIALHEMMKMSNH